MDRAPTLAEGEAGLEAGLEGRWGRRSLVSGSVAGRRRGGRGWGGRLVRLRVCRGLVSRAGRPCLLLLMVEVAGRDGVGRRRRLCARGLGGGCFAGLWDRRVRLRSVLREVRGLRRRRGWRRGRRGSPGRWVLRGARECPLQARWRVQMRRGRCSLCFWLRRGIACLGCCSLRGRCCRLLGGWR